ncbi:MAG: hypothetical protein DMF61_19250 [Blastocatellia bacterium AA13]|nr:MAG: hypothetical protein DMF61_19250 [Blastocatellia bacterium AA13]
MERRVWTRHLSKRGTFHELYHRGQIALTLKQAGHPLDKKIAYGQWEWGVR